MSSQSRSAPLRTGPVHSAATRSGHRMLSQVRQGVLLARAGRFETTADLLDDIRHRMRGHPVAEAAPVLPGVLANLGLAQTMCGRFPQAEDHLARAHALTRERGLRMLGLVTRQNRGCLALYRGEAPTAIDTFLGLLPHLPAERREALHVDLAEALLAEGLVEEAATALDDGPRTEPGSATAGALLVEAKLRLLEGDRARAAELTRQVRAVFGPGSLWYRLAARLEHLALRPARHRAPAARARDRLALRLPLAAPAPEAPTPAHRALDALECGARRAPGPWLGGAARDPHVVRAGLKGSLASGRPRDALEWAELTRTWARGHLPGPHEPATPSLSALAGDYRAALAGGRGPHSASRALAWEAARWRAWHAAGRRPDPVPRSRICDRLLDRLGPDRGFVHFTAADGTAVALVAAGGRVHSRPLGPLTGAVRAVARLVHALTGDRARSPRVRAAAAEAARILLGPVLPLVGDRPLAVAAEPCFGDPPWGMLPALCGRPVNLVPTARSWVEHADAPGTPVGRTLLVAAPEPEGARREVAALARLYPGARVLSGGQARWGRVLEEAAEADSVHLAGHGQVPRRTPMLASVALDGGPLLARDLAGLARAPSLVTLSACWTGRGFTAVTGAPSGFVGALHARGVRTVVASPVPVGDTAVEAAMVRFHRALVGGVPVAEAVALHLGPVGFCCFGA
ncbi:CHAT domain-containing protein [Nocardiopsis sp. LOL_012]|uniref:CHAT domain-containing protein n=1 Tax=Nocardiopsis sp. LOL_012 TaxID=3345409 RepID=UPI003A86DC40